MRAGTDKAKLLAFLDGIGRAAEGPGGLYLVGGSCALLLGIRDQTLDIDLKLDPEPKAAFEAIAKLKEQLDVNVELAAPDQFLPALPGWRERSEFIMQTGQVECFHYDFYGQALAKILRSHGHDLSDVRALIRLGKVEAPRLKEYFQQIEPELIRYPAVNSADFAGRLDEFLAEGRH